MMTDRKKTYNRRRRNQTFLTGIYLAINAIQKVRLLMDGPDCAYTKVELFENNHDLFASMYDEKGLHKISTTRVGLDSLIVGHHDMTDMYLERTCAADNTQAVFISSEPVVALTGVDYGMLASRAQAKTCVKIIPAPYQSLDKDWLDGYAYIMERIAEDLDLSSEKRKKGSLAIVGFLFERNEGDSLGNIQELKRMIEAFSLDLCSVWLSGQDFDTLASVEEAEIIIRLPYGGRAADIVAQKTGAVVVDLPLPIGIEATKEWMLALGAYAGKKEKAEHFIDKEVSHLMKQVGWIVPAHLQGTQCMFSGDPFLAEALCRALSEIDMSLKKAVLFSRKEHLRDLNLPDKTYTEFDEFDFSADAELALGCSNGRPFAGNDVPYLELGFPSYATHFMSPHPYMGFKGFLLLINRIINKILDKHMDRKHPQRP
ncbi:MAG: nitrogenase component 1 [Nanoarchaeota archaeon]